MLTQEFSADTCLLLVTITVVAFSALLDACVLYPVGVRDLLLCVAERRVFVPYWSAEILDEVERNIVNDGRLFSLQAAEWLMLIGGGLTGLLILMI